MGVGISAQLELKLTLVKSSAAICGGGNQVPQIAEAESASRRFISASFGAGGLVLNCRRSLRGQSEDRGQRQEVGVPERIQAREAAGILGISVRSVQVHAANGILPGAAKIGGIWTFDEKALRSWLKTISTPDLPVPKRASGPDRARNRSGAWMPLQARNSADAYERALKELRQLGKDKR